MSNFPDRFPYRIRKTATSLGFRKTCAHCSNGVEYPIAYMASIDVTHIYYVTDKSRQPVVLCNKVCAAEYFWKEYCIRRLNGNFN